MCITQNYVKGSNLNSLILIARSFPNARNFIARWLDFTINYFPWTGARDLGAREALPVSQTTVRGDRKQGAFCQIWCLSLPTPAYVQKHHHKIVQKTRMVTSSTFVRVMALCFTIEHYRNHDRAVTLKHFCASSFIFHLEFLAVCRIQLHWFLIITFSFT